MNHWAWSCRVLRQRNLISAISSPWGTGVGRGCRGYGWHCVTLWWEECSQCPSPNVDYGKSAACDEPSINLFHWSASNWDMRRLQLASVQMSLETPYARSVLHREECEMVNIIFKTIEWMIFEMVCDFSKF